ncbi:6512_t:CDS:2, partial [Scutellospora calospora]
MPTTSSYSIHLEFGDYSIGNKAIKKIASNCTNLKYLSLKRCKRISNKVLKKLNSKIKIKRPDYSDNEFSDSDLPSLIPIFTDRQNKIAITRSFRDYYLNHTSDEIDLISVIVNYLRENPPMQGKILVKALINISSKFNTISKSFFNKLKKDYGIHDPVENLYRDIIGKIKCLDLQFCYKGKWQSLDTKISFGHSLKTYDSYARIIIDDIEDIIRFIIHAVKKSTSHYIISDFYKYQYCYTSSHRKKRKNKKAKVARTISVSELKSSVSDLSNSSISSSEIEVIHIHKTGAVRKCPILKYKVKDKVNYQ